MLTAIDEDIEDGDNEAPLPAEFDYVSEGEEDGN